MTVDMERPWIPVDADETFDPLAHAGVEPAEDTPMIVTPRGGAREVGRSCCQVDTEHATYLVDCGLNQGAGETFPDLRGLEVGEVAAVFLTHAHVDHSGGLPVLEARGVLQEEATIVATPPTISLVKILLEDSLAIHRREAQRRGTDQQFTRADVDAVFERFEPVDYGGGRVEGVAPVTDSETLVFRLGNAAHLLGSAWLSLQAGGHRVVFSGDVGNRATHLPDLTTPPEADLLVLESTYGSLHSHRSMSDARSAVFAAVERALREREPVLVPTFAVGRAQLLQLLFAERLPSLSDRLADRVRLVVDGMSREATETYHEYVRDTTYVDESVVNRVEETGWDRPFLPDGVAFPESDADRRAILEDADPSSGGKVPIVVSPSGMLTGGNSPRYLVEFAARFDSATVLLTGYQARNTTGRALQNQLEAGVDEITFTTDAEPLGNGWPSSPHVAWVSGETDDPTDLVTRATIPASWVTRLDGLSAHASQDGLLEFARAVRPRTIALVHGPDYAQNHLGRHLAKNVSDVEEVTRSRLLTPIEVSADSNVATASVTPEMLDTSDRDTHQDKIEHLYDLVADLYRRVADDRPRPPLTEEEVREIVRDEVGE